MIIICVFEADSLRLKIIKIVYYNIIYLVGLNINVQLIEVYVQTQ